MDFIANQKLKTRPKFFTKYLYYYFRIFQNIFALSSNRHLKLIIFLCMVKLSSKISYSMPSKIHQRFENVI